MPPVLRPSGARETGGSVAKSLIGRDRGLAHATGLTRFPSWAATPFDLRRYGDTCIKLSRLRVERMDPQTLFSSQVPMSEISRLMLSGFIK